jgi:hypothetical protein
MIHVATLSDPSYVNSNTILNFAITNKVVCIVSMQISGLAPISKKKNDEANMYSISFRNWTNFYNDIIIFKKLF